MEITNVTNIPIRRVRPTVLMGAIGTMDGHIRTLNPIMVVNADSRIA